MAFGFGDVQWSYLSTPLKDFWDWRIEVNLHQINSVNTKIFNCKLRVCMHLLLSLSSIGYLCFRLLCYCIVMYFKGIPTALQKQSYSLYTSIH